MCTTKKLVIAHHNT